MDLSPPADPNNQLPGKVQKTPLPISRNNGPGYERPERARTSHACEPCRERKTKCDGERPSCRRCLHTGTGCHYGYGKGWRKRKTAEDLTATSKKLQRYEALFDHIMPKVSPDIQAMIDDVRREDAATSGTPESVDSSTSGPSQSQHYGDSDRASANSNTRLPLPLPIPNNTNLQQNRSTPGGHYDHMSEPTSPNLAHHPKRELQYDESTNNRLPSITPHGMLIENGVRDVSPNYPRQRVQSSSDRADHFSPTSPNSNFQDSSLRTGWSSLGLETQHQKADISSSLYASPRFDRLSPTSSLGHHNEHDHHDQHQLTDLLAVTA